MAYYQTIKTKRIVPKTNRAASLMLRQESSIVRQSRRTPGRFKATSNLAFAA